MYQNSHLVDAAKEEVAETSRPFVDAEKAQFIWHSRNQKSAGLVVSPRGTQTERLRPLAKSTGADTSGWLKSDRFTPETVFGNLLGERWLNTREYVSVIAEFAKIDTCDWARNLLRGMASSVGAFYGDDERSPYDQIKNIQHVERFKRTIFDRLRIMEIELVPDLGDL